MRKQHDVDYQRRASMTVKDTWQCGKIVFVIDVYGLSLRDTLTIFPEDSPPYLRAMGRMGLDPARYRAEWEKR
jgi:hypothetical protein